MMNFETLCQSRRSCRSFDTTPIPKEQLDAILKAGQWAPSPLNMQPWEFIVVTDPEAKARIRKVGEDAKQDVLGGGGPEWAGKYSMDFLEEAPVLVVVLFDPSKGGLGNFFDQKDGALQGASACIQNMMLAAADIEVGSVWFTFFRPDSMKKVLDIPDTLEIAAVLPFGKVKGPVKAPPRKALRVHHERYQKGE